MDHAASLHDEVPAEQVSDRSGVESLTAPSGDQTEQHEPTEVAETTSVEGPQVAPTTEAQPEVSRRSQQKRLKKSASKPAVEPIDGREAGSKGVAVELPVDLDRRLTAYRIRTKKSHPTILLDAVEKTYEQLPGLIRKALGVEDESPRTNLFDRGPRVPAPIRLDEGVEKVRHTIRIAKPHRELLDSLTDQFGAPSRNFLIVTAYDAFLPKN